MFDLLRSHGADISNAGPLHFAVLGRSASIPMIEYLVGLGIDGNTYSNAVRAGHGRLGTTLACALKWRKLEEAKRWQERGAVEQV
jgi:hypothetical protein